MKKLAKEFQTSAGKPDYTAIAIVVTVLAAIALVVFNFTL